MIATTDDEVVAALAAARTAGRTLTPIGGGTRSRCGRVVDGDETISTSGLVGIVEHIPAELTVTVRAGTTVEHLAEHLAQAGQWWPQVDSTPGSTVGGVVAAGASGMRRLRHGPVRDCVLEVVLITGDGRRVRGGGPTVKGVAGYDLPRLMVGARGTLGVLTQVTLKLTPLPEARAWFRVADGPDTLIAHARALVADPRRPSAVILTPGALHVELAGVAEDVVAPHGFTATGAPPRPTGDALIDVSVPVARIPDLVAHLDTAGLPYSAQFGVGAAHVAIDGPHVLGDLRRTVHHLGGYAVVADAPPVYRDDPWGRLPPGVGIMRRMYQAFDPSATLSPGHRLGT